MNLITDFLIASGGFAAAFYCYTLSRRLKRFTALESGMGSAIAVLSAQVDDMTHALQTARASAESSASSLERQVQRAESAAARLEVLLASLHDLPGEPEDEDTGTSLERRARFIRRRGDRHTGARAAE